MMKLYTEFSTTASEKPIAPSWIINDSERFDEILTEHVELFQDDLFPKITKRDSSEFIQLLANKHFKWLQPHHLRLIIHSKIVLASTPTQATEDINQ